MELAETVEVLQRGLYQRLCVFQGGGTLSHPLTWFRSAHALEKLVSPLLLFQDIMLVLVNLVAPEEF